MNSLIHSLIEHGNKLSSLLHKLKIPGERSPNTKDDVKEAVDQTLESLNNLDQLPDSFPRKVVIKVLEKMQATLQKFAKYDNHNANEYQKLVGKVDNLKNKNWSPTITSPVLLAEQRNIYTSSSFRFLLNDDQNSDYEEAYKKLESNERKCLSLCSSLLPNDNNNDNDNVSLVELSNKRQLVHWWMGLNLIKSPKEGEDLLAKLVEEEFIIRRSSGFSSNSALHSSSSSSSKYVMHSLSKVNQDTTFTKSEKSTPHILCLSRSNNTEGIVAAINTRTQTLNAETCEMFSKMNNVEILHLGRWPYNPKNYVVVEDIGSLRNMTRNWPNITSLSFQGIAGIVELPDTVYKLNTLKILDLKACPNLEYLPKGISSLSNLTHLDVSECYLLNHIPKEAASLTELRVLKGFIINPTTADEQCTLNELSRLTNLEKLAIRARAVKFPTEQDLKTLCEIHQLRKLKVTWVINKANRSQFDRAATVNSESEPSMLDLPATLEKLELQAAPKKMALQLLDLISCRARNCPEKLCIRGGGLRKLEPYKYRFLHVKKLYLQYLPKLHMEWSDLQQLFPKLSHLEVYDCPNLIFFPSGSNGQWNKSEHS